MTTAVLKNDQLPNNRLEVFKTNFEQSSHIIEFSIPVSKDGVET